MLKRMSPLSERLGKAPGAATGARVPVIFHKRMRKLSEVKVAVIGLGYVGLPLATEFGKLRSVVGFDINQARIDALENGYDATLEVSPDEIAGSLAPAFHRTLSTTSLSAMSS